MYRGRQQFYLTTAHRDALALAFKLMRRQGLIARQNFMCCQNCAGYGLATMVVAFPEAKRAKVKGCAYYHGQDAANLRDDGEFYLAYGQLETTEHGTVGLPTAEVGRMVMQALAEAGVPAEWDGNPDRRILISFKPKPAPEPETTPAEHFLKGLGVL